MERLVYLSTMVAIVFCVHLKPFTIEIQDDVNLKHDTINTLWNDIFTHLHIAVRKDNKTSNGISIVFPQGHKPHKIQHVRPPHVKVTKKPKFPSILPPPKLPQNDFWNQIFENFPSFDLDSIYTGTLVPANTDPEEIKKTHNGKIKPSEWNRKPLIPYRMENTKGVVRKRVGRNVPPLKKLAINQKPLTPHRINNTSIVRKPPVVEYTTYLADEPNQQHRMEKTRGHHSVKDPHGYKESSYHTDSDLLKRKLPNSLE